MDPKGLIDNFINVVTKHYIDFSGRARRAEFWQFVLVYFVVAFLLSLVRLQLVVSLIGLALLLPNLGVAVRRLHDVDITGWYLLLPMVPALLMALSLFIFFPLAILFGIATLAADIYVIYLLAKPGTAGSNQYGPDPKAAF